MITIQRPILLFVSTFVVLASACTADGDPSDTTLAETTDAESESESESGSESDTTIADSTNEDMRDEGCACIVDETYEGLQPPDTYPSGPTCGTATCAHVQAACTGDDSFCESLVELDATQEEALACAITALRDRTPGVLTWSLSDPAQMIDSSGYVLILEDGRAVIRDQGAQDLTGNVSNADLGALAEASVFEACLADTDDAARFDCLRRAMLSDFVVCDEGWTIDLSGN